jgi:hypothetical protein
MTDFDPAATAAFPLQEATDWIGRWKDAGGGFFCKANHDTGEVQVQLAFQGESEIMPPDATALQTELLINPALKGAVTTLVVQAWSKASAVAAMPPAGSA